MEESFPHLPLQREEPVTEKRPPGRYPRAVPGDPAAHGRALRDDLESAKAEVETDIGGFDQRRLFRFTVEKGFNPDDLSRISADIELVSQEGDDVVVAFVSAAALESFEARLTSLAGGGRPKYKEVLYALHGIDGWRVEDRTGWALHREGLPDTAPFLLDVELWPLEDHPEEREQLWATFEGWLQEQGVERVDAVRNAGLTLYRVRCDHHDQAQTLLHHRDIRSVDLPPRYGLELHLFGTDIQDIPEIAPPPEDAPGVVVLDSGLTTGHPLLAPAVGDAQSFLPGKDATDEHGHGTLVAGLALYGDIETSLRNGDFAPRLRLFSGRILDERNENDTGFVENQITEAVRYFNGEYGCRVFNLSFGDLNKPYLGKHLKGLSYTLDSLSRELGVLFIVSAGNVPGGQLDGLAWRNHYPEYLTEPEWALVEPAPALNVLTVGSLARHEQTSTSQRNPGDPAEVPVARRDQPSPFSRHGHSIGGAMKPELVAYGGNWAVNTLAGANWLVDQGIGELSLSRNFASGHLFASESGTSLAAPQIAHLAAALLSEHPDADPNLIRALLVSHAAVPKPTAELLTDKVILRQVCGYGRVDDYALFRSLENAVTLRATDRIANRCHHFYEVPVPEEFMSSGPRLRELAVAMAHTPVVRSTRIAYKATRMGFRVVAAEDLDHVSRMFSKATDSDEYERIPELAKASVGPQLRDKGTVQASAWCFRRFDSRSALRKKRLFIVVTRNDFPWGESHSAEEEEYALVVCLRDRENERARLYSEIRSRLQARTRARVRV